VNQKPETEIRLMASSVVMTCKGSVRHGHT